MDFSINATTDSTFITFTPGIQENCVLESVKFEPADKEGLKAKVLRFNFKGPKGERHIETIFPIDAEQTAKAAASWGRVPQEVIQEEVQALSGKVQHIMSTYMDKKDTFLNATSWEAFCTQVIGKLGSSFVGVPVRLKLVLNTKDYLQLPKKAKAPFIQKMSESSSLSINPKYDNVVFKPKAAVVADPFAISAQSDAAFGAPSSAPGVAAGAGDAFAF